MVYRLGGGDSRIDAVRQLEIPSMKSVLAEFYNYAPMFTCILVNRNTKAKLFQPVEMDSLIHYPVLLLLMLLCQMKNASI